MKRTLSLVMIAAACLVVQAQPLISIPLTLSGTSIYTWQNAIWWTNVPPQTNVETWQAFWAIITNFATLQSEVTGASNTAAAAAPMAFAAGVSNNVTAATNALNTAISSRGYLTGNQALALSGDATGNGTTNISVTVSNIQPPVSGSVGQPLVKTATGVAIGPIAASAVTGLTDADTNSMLNSGTFVAFVTNAIYTTAGTTNILPWSFTNYAGCTYTATSGVPTMLWSTDSGTTWNQGAETLITNVGVELAIFGGPIWGLSTNPIAFEGDVGLTNLIGYGLSRSDLFGRTNHLVGQRLQVGTPLYSSDAVPKSYADGLAGQIGQLNATQEGQLNSYGLHPDSVWDLYSASSNNILTATFLGAYSWGARYPLPSAITNGVIASIANRTNATVKVLTNGLAVAPVLKITHYLSPLNWTYLSSTPTIISTNYVFTFVLPYTDSAFVAPVLPSSSPGIFNLASVLQLTPRTITNSTDTTWTNAPGMLCCDSNYLYISVGTNLWKRAALSSW